MRKSTTTTTGRHTQADTASGPSAVSELQDHVGFWLRFVSNHVSGSFRKRVEAEGVSVSEWVALRQLHEAGQTTPSALMNTLGMTKGAISKIVSRLQQKSLVARVFLEHDLRTQQITLTAQGKALVPRLAALADANDDAFFGHLSTSQRQELIALMQQIVHQHQLRQLPVE